MEEKTKRVDVSIDHGQHAFFTDNATILHNPTKFIIDFTQTIPTFDNIGGRAQQSFTIKHNTLILEPQFAKIFLEILQQNLKKYESKFGKIKMPKQQKSKVKEMTQTEGTRYIG